MAVKARKITIVYIDKNKLVHQEEAVEFYDESTNSNVDPTHTSLTKEDISKMTIDAFNGN